MQKNTISFKGQKIFIGIDVHKKNWDVAVAPEVGVVNRHPQKASAQELFVFLKKHYPDGDYLAVYESGFTGFSTYYALKDVGINCIVIHAADVPTTQYEEVMKTDKIDSVKLARTLKAGLLKGVYVRERDNIDDRSVIRIRKTIQKDLSSYRVRIKHLLHNNGVSIPERFEKSGSHWSRTFMRWLKEDVNLLSSSRNSLNLLISQVEAIRSTLLESTLLMRDLSQTERYKKNVDLLTTIPGIGVTIAMCILTEVYDVSRFRNEREFASYLGLIPTTRSSGNKIMHGEMTFRGNKQLSTMVIEAAWVAIGHDAGMGSLYQHYKERLKPQEAIVRIARKLSNVIFSVLKNRTEYVPYYMDN